MSSTDNGIQVVTFDFRQDATSINFNKYNANVLKSGIYKGGRVYFQRYTQGNDIYYKYVIQPFTATFLIPESSLTTDVNKKLLVNVTTLDDAVFASTSPTDQGFNDKGIPSTGNSLYLIMTLDWVKSINNYINFSVITDPSLLPSNGLIICRLYGNGSQFKPDIFYDATSYGSFYESYDDKFTNYNNGLKGVETNYGEFYPPELTQYPKRLIPYTSDSYYLEFTSFAGDEKFHYISLQPFNGQIEFINTEDYREKMKFTFNVSGDVNVEVSAKVKLVNNSSRVSNSMSFYVDAYGRLSIFNGYSSSRKYVIKTNIFNNARKLNTFTSIY